MALRSAYWAARFSAWPERTAEQEGYSLLMPVPGDLPVFLELALATCATQDAEHRIETIVVPDRPTGAVRAIVAERAAGWNGPLRLQPFPRPERELLPRMGNPFHNYGIQLITGVSVASGSHVILHDADLFLTEPSGLDGRYTRTRDEGLDVSGVDQAWDTWFTDHDLTIAATWELCARRDWLRSFPPYLHMGHEGELLGERHIFDITLHAQGLSDQRRIAIHDHGDRIVHFNHVIGTYRHFQKAHGSFDDDRFRLLLIRLFIDLFAQHDHPYDLPTIEELALGLDDPRALVRYPPVSDRTRQDYADYRRKLQLILTGAWASADRADDAATALRAFDAHYHYAPERP